MEPKYYTPDISEFHPGFLFQQKTSDTGDDIYDWDNMFMTTDFPEDINLTRVKILDKEDIEECGWKEGSFGQDLSNSPYLQFIIADPRESPKLHGTLLTWRYDGFGDNITIGTHTGRYVIFQGNIKNKSELKRVMQMLDII